MPPFVSIVVPVYNTEKYISQCIESILSQTYKNFECIIVNNCSTDRSYEIIKNYGKSDNRVKVHNNTDFLSQTNNFNHALNQISIDSKYCKMVLADDFIFKECIEKMVDVAESCPNIGIVSSYSLRGSDVSNVGLPFGEQLYDGKEIGKRYLLEYDFDVFGTETTVLYLSEIIRKTVNFYDELSLSADTEICLEILKNYDFGFVNQVLSYTRMDNLSTRDNMKHFDTGIMRKMILFVRYGKYFLNEEEYNATYSSLEARYYKSISAKIIINRKLDFWNTHVEALKIINEKIHISKLIKYMTIGILDKMGNPKKFFEDIFLKDKYKKLPP